MRKIYHLFQVLKFYRHVVLHNLELDIFRNLIRLIGKIAHISIHILRIIIYLISGELKLCSENPSHMQIIETKIVIK